MITEQTPSASPSRRRLLGVAGTAVAGIVAAAVSGCGSSGSKSHAGTTITPTPGPDVPILNHALDLERAAIAAYTAAAPLLSGSAHLAAQRFLAQEIAHAGELAGLIKQAGGMPNKPSASYDLGHPHNTSQLLGLLHTLERAQIAAYLAAIPQLSKDSTRAAIAAICANDAQHVSVLRLALGRNPVPGAFVDGTE